MDMQRGQLIICSLLPGFNPAYTVPSASTPASTQLARSLKAVTNSQSVQNRLHTTVPYEI